jgi:regulator of PEP synthase PpsR (kinase-PPPase family)
MVIVFAVSDATGGTVEQVVRAALAQFEGDPVEIVRRDLVRDPQRVREVAAEAAARKAILFHTLVSNRLRQVMLDEARERGVDAMDIMGPLLDRLAAHLKHTPQEKPGLSSQLAKAKSREIEAVEYAFHHDDGHGADDLSRAEIVLTGVSRTMKTPTMLYLAYRGWFAANVPLIPNIAPPQGLFAVPSEQVFCLFVDARRLLELRQVRAGREGIPMASYAAPDEIRKELLHAQQLAARRDWRRIDVTAKSVEEVCQEIITLRGGQHSE